MHYRKIYEVTNQCSLLPGIEIHHIDGNSSNNDPQNLLAVTIEEHLQIHKSQQDWGAVQAILMRMEHDPDEISEAARKKQLELIQEGNHNFQRMSKERRVEISRRVGHMTHELGIGLHKINADPILSKENASRGGKASQAKRKDPAFANLNTLGGKSVSGTKWYYNTKTGQRLRVNTQPIGEEWVEGTGKQNIIGPRDHVKNTQWWFNTITNERRRLKEKPTGEHWQKGFTIK